jgi:hypothetical protein
MDRSARVVVLVSLVFLGCGDQDSPDPGDAASSGAHPTSFDPPPLDASTGAEASTGDATTAASGTTTGPETSGAPLEPTGGGEDASTTSVDDTTGTTGTSGTTGTTGTTGDVGSTGEPGPPSFMVDMWPLVFPECGCHVDENAAGDLYLGKKVAYDNLVGKMSQQADDMLLIDPGSPETSYVWHKLQGTHDDVDGGDGKLMPPGGSLEPEELDLFRAWIEQGALP